jgi:two-component system, sensor histidine kinase YesM
MYRLRERKNTLQIKQAIAFTMIIAVVMSISIVLHLSTVGMVRDMSYEKMRAQAEYYQGSFDKEINHILNLQVEFCNDSNLLFLAHPEILLSDYERRDALLSVKENIGMITGVSNLIEGGILYLPKSGYKITAGAIGRISGKDLEEMSNYLLNQDNILHYKTDRFFIIRTGEKNLYTEEAPSYVFVLTFSSDQIRKNLSLLNTSEKSGAFIYNKEIQLMLESSTTELIGSEIYQQLKKDESGDYESVQHINIGGKSYLVFVGGNGVMGIFVQYILEAPIIKYITVSWTYMIGFIVCLIGMSIGFILYTRKIIYKPMYSLMSAFQKVKEGNFNEHIYHNDVDEFAFLYEGFNDMEDKLKQLIDEIFVQKNLAQKAQMKQLQAQINPHFLYNSFFTLSRRIKRQDYDNAEKFSQHLGNYFKYLTRNGSDYIALKQEIEHAKSYTDIQGMRFAGRLVVEFNELPKEYLILEVPRLILQPLIENAFEHGLENKMEGGLLRICFITENGKLLIKVEDNGENTDNTVIEKMQHSLNEGNSLEVTGIVNIHRRLQIYYKGNAGVLVQRSDLGGVAVTIYITLENQR